MTKEAISSQQALLLLNMLEELDLARRAHAQALFPELSSLPVAGDAQGRDLHTLLEQTSPLALEHLKKVFAHWVDCLNEMTAEADRQRAVIFKGAANQNTTH